MYQVYIFLWLYSIGILQFSLCTASLRITIYNIMLNARVISGDEFFICLIIILRDIYNYLYTYFNTLLKRNFCQNVVFTYMVQNDPCILVVKKLKIKIEYTNKKRRHYRIWKE